MFQNALQQLGARSHEDLPRRWQQIVSDANAQLALRELPLIELRTTDEVVVGYVNRGRWVADCPHCNGGIAVSPEFPACACLDCGRIYRAAVPDPVSIEAATVILERRAVQNQNWDTGTESIAVLRAENVVYGLSPEVTLEIGDKVRELPAVESPHGRRIAAWEKRLPAHLHPNFVPEPRRVGTPHRRELGTAG